MSDDKGRSLVRRLRWQRHHDGDGTQGELTEFERRPSGDAERWDDEIGAAESPTAGDVFLARADGRTFERRQLDRIDEDALNRRRQLWRDTALLLSGLVAALLVANLVLPELTGIAPASPSPAAPGVFVAPSPSGQGAVGATPAPSVAAEPGGEPPRTASPAVTLPPTGTHPPSTPKPIVTPRPTRPPTTPRPTAPPPTGPPPTAEITPTPPPTVHVSCSALLLQVSCSVTMTDGVAGSESWDMNGSGTVVAGGNGSDSITFLYDTDGTYHVVVSITGLDGSSASDGTDVTVSAT